MEGMSWMRAWRVTRDVLRALAAGALLLIAAELPLPGVVTVTTHRLEPNGLHTKYDLR